MVSSRVVTPDFRSLLGIGVRRFLQLRPLQLEFPSCQGGVEAQRAARFPQAEKFLQAAIRAAREATLN